MCKCKKYQALVAARDNAERELTRQLLAYIADGDEYHTALTRDDLIAAGSLARLVHKHSRYRTPKGASF
jgi:hypothetical protein